MILFTFRITFEEHHDMEAIVTLSSQHTFYDLHMMIQKAIKFDASKDVSFYMCNDNWIKGREISSVRKTEIADYRAAKLNTYINNPQQKILYLFDFDEEWWLQVRLIKIAKANGDEELPKLVRVVGAPPRQYKPKPGKQGSPSNEMEQLADILMNASEPKGAGDDENKVTDDDSEE